MNGLSRFTVVPRLPDKLERLRGIAHNLWWCWDPEAIELFFRIDRDLWIGTNQNPVLMLGKVSQVRLEELAHDESYLAHLDRVAVRMDDYLNTKSWEERNPNCPDNLQVAYFSAEFGIHESIAIYSGGLGVLAGDYLKACSDLCLPLVGVGLLYREGYHQQYLNADGWQQERYPQNDIYNLPFSPVPATPSAQLRPDQLEGTGLNPSQMVIEVGYPERQVYARVWVCQVGRVPMYLLDCDFDANEPDDREITARLYGGDSDMRIRQEILLGVGGVTLLQALGIRPTMYHMNEGHSAFLTLERIRRFVEGDNNEETTLPLESAIEAVKATSAFTTHTPVPAGNDMFPPEMMTHYFASYWERVGMTTEQFLGLGRQDPADSREPFCMTVLALKLSAGANGVSQLHGCTARSMWARTWPDVPEEEIPITAITNGIHARYWVSRDMASLYDRYIGPSWDLNPSDKSVWAHIDEVPDAELWRTHERRRERLVNFARRRLGIQLRRRGSPQAEVQGASEALDPEVLTIGFARRFATYKRAIMLLSDPDRLLRLLNNPESPLQIIFAGKAHPADSQGKELIRSIIHFIRKHDLRHRMIFVEDYDMNVARYMVQGVDCWLNTPRRPLEASGTSGMKAAANGALNISIPDGWWCEAELLGENGWSIGRGENYEDPDEQDMVEGQMLYELLEQEIVPAFYDRGRDGLPRTWIGRMKNAIRTICPVFNSHRMAQEYADRFYIPAANRRNALYADDRERTHNLAQWKQKVRGNWSKVHFVGVHSGPRDNLPYGSELEVVAELSLGALSDRHVTVEIYYGDIDEFNRIVTGKPVPMHCTGGLGDGVYRFEGAIRCEKTGQQAFTVRAIPSHADLACKHETALIVWA
jgi:glycogen phosphorylase